MPGSAVEVQARADGSLVIHPYGALDADDAVELRCTLVRAVRHVRPLRLILDLGDVDRLNPINVGTLAAVCYLGDDHQVAVSSTTPRPTSRTSSPPRASPATGSGTSGRRPRVERLRSRDPGRA
jgi:anti-anti-sigma regulatory factor